jgi:phage major head subunit gpT-like protein
MIINKTTIQSVFTTLKAVFNKAFAEAPSTWQKIAMLVPAPSGTVDYAWMSNFPQMKEWIGDKVVKALKAFKYTISARDFEATIAVKRKDMERDQLGIYKPQAMGAGQAAKEFPDELVYEAVNGSFANKCYDGQYFCDTDHAVGSDGKIVSVSNKITAPLSNATKALADASFGAARTMMRKFKSDEGRNLNIRPNILLVPPALEITAIALMTNDKLADDTPNPYKGMAEVVCDGRLSSDTAWFLLDTTRPVKPFIYQETKKPHFVQQTNPEAEDVFMRGEYKFGAEAEAEAGYGFWQMCVGSTGLG